MSLASNFVGNPSLTYLFKAIETAKHVNSFSLPQTPETGVYVFEFEDGAKVEVVLEIKRVELIK